MKNFKSIAMAIALIVLMTISVNIASAEDMKLNAEVTRIEQRIDKNGAPYVMAIVKFERTQDGLTYPRELPLMFFGDKNDDRVKALQVGDVIDAQVNYRKLSDGRESFSLISWR